MAKKRRLPGTKAQRKRAFREVHAADSSKPQAQQAAIALDKVRRRQKRGKRKG